MAPWFQRSIWLAAVRRWCSHWQTSCASCLSCRCRALPRANLHISDFRASAMHPKCFAKFQYKSFGYTREKLETPCLFAVVFSWLTKSGTLKGYLYFRNALLIFMIFRNTYGRAIKVGMYVCSLFCSWKNFGALLFVLLLMNSKYCFALRTALGNMVSHSLFFALVKSKYCLALGSKHQLAS